MIGVLLVDDQAVVRLGFRMALDDEDDLIVVGEAADGLEALRLAGELVPDVVVMDVRMPRLDGVQATRRLLATAPPPGHDGPGWPPRVLVVTTYEMDDVVFGSLEAGASGFLLKTASLEELVGAVRTVAAGEALVAPAVTRRLIEAYVRPGAVRRRHSTLTRHLTERETHILGRLARGLSNAGIARELAVSESTVKSHVSSLLVKLGIRSRAQAVVLAYEIGLVAPGEIDLDDIRDR
ncbi:MAG TPA: response regulator transcription factor [Pseudonocardia sp.]|nr:response regulator transcription factor [Pseudonocardia sp.]